MSEKKGAIKVLLERGRQSKTTPPLEDDPIQIQIKGENCKPTRTLTLAYKIIYSLSLSLSF
jgi:hypothetical protein